MSTRTSVMSLCAALAIALSIGSPALAAPEFQSLARLFGPTALKGKAVYLERLHGATTEQRFKVELQHGVPGREYTVRVNGADVGTITINSIGRGQLQLRTPEFIDDPGDGDPIPDNFPTLDTGDLVTVGPLVGIFFDSLDPTQQQYLLQGELNGPGGGHGSVEYKEHFDDGALEREFEVEIEDAAPNQTFPVLARGKVVGSIHTNANGRGRLELRTPAFINGPGDGDPMPNTFPSLRAGDHVKVGSGTATLSEI